MDKNELKLIISEEQNMYLGKRYSYMRATRSKRYMIWKYLSLFRRAQFYKQQIASTNGLLRIIAKIQNRRLIRKKNSLSAKCGVEIANSSLLGRRLDIWHGGVVINCDLGDDCVFHGNNIVGNKGIGKSHETPVLGNGVDVGAGAVVIGKINIADNCVIGANAVVTKDFVVPGSIIVGIPGRALNR